MLSRHTVVSLRRLGRLPDVGTQWLSCEGSAIGPNALMLRAMGALGESAPRRCSVGMLIPWTLVGWVLRRQLSSCNTTRFTTFKSQEALTCIVLLFCFVCYLGILYFSSTLLTNFTTSWRFLYKHLWALWGSADHLTSLFYDADGEHVAAVTVGA